ncbi:hypothetical protein P3X46_009998 [Hevea brasiliensis]|nr:uncharacterized protein LOC110664183 [Hevea brasiliensis]KAJ9178086.1 hypothetical protein P3X46_009998 [Hevea brasiliensis]
MDALHSSKKISKLNTINGSVSPINTRFNADSTLIRYLRGGSPITSSPCNAKNDAFSSQEFSSSRSSFGRSLSPLSSIENVMSTPVYGTPVKVVDHDVLVMDGILVESVSGGRVSRSLASDSGDSSSNSSSSSPGISVYKTELCRSWEEFGQCRYGSKCQFAHGKEELRPTCFPMKSKAETHAFKSHTAASYSFGQKSRFLMAEGAVAASHSKPEYRNRSPNIASSSITLAQRIKPEIHNKKPQDWSPLDDGIKVALPGDVDYSLSRKDVDAYIHRILHGPRTGKRLPVFTEFCL